MSTVQEVLSLVSALGDHAIPYLVRVAASPQASTHDRVRAAAAARVLIRRTVRQHDRQRVTITRQSRPGQSRLDQVYDDRMQRVAVNLSPGNWTGD